MQHFLNNDTFTVHYWDWRKEDERTSLFESNRLGAHNSVTPQVTGDLLLNGWETICWYSRNGNMNRPEQNICNPGTPTGSLQRCPVKTACAANYSGWPSYDDVRTAVSMGEYDWSPYNRYSQGFRNYMEGFHIVDQCDVQTRGQDLCMSVTINGTDKGLQRLLHNTVSCDCGEVKIIIYDLLLL